jgi:hypothetical protein
MLVPVSWWILVARVIHAERLVGNTQFWITRPYTWQGLLAAKLFFLAVFIYLPYLVAQILLLGEAGFNPLHFIPGLLYKSLFFVSAFLLPLAALAAITSNFARMTLTMLGILIAAIILVVLIVFTSGIVTGGQPLPTPIANRLALALFLSFCGAALILQYFLRKVWLARAVLLAIPLLLCAVAFLDLDQRLINHTYPVSAAELATNQAAEAKSESIIQLDYKPETVQGHEGFSTYRSNGKVRIGVEIPLVESGVADGTLVRFDAIQADLTAPDGTHWNSAWQDAWGNVYLPGESVAYPGFILPVEFYTKFQSVPLTVRLTLAITQARASQTVTLPVSTGNFNIPDFGPCSPTTGPIFSDGRNSGINCLSALRKPPLTKVNTRWSIEPCSGAQAASDAGNPSMDLLGSLESDLAEFSMIPVEHELLTNYFNGKSTHLCPGTPITFTSYHAIRRTQTSIVIQDFHLRKIKMEGGQVSLDK